MTSDADETPEQTRKVIGSVLSTEDSDGSEAEIEKWLDYQRWLEAEAPYRVVIPYRGAINAAFNRRWATMEKSGEKPRLRLRRDVHGFLTAIKTSAILHKAQREKDGTGRIVATLDDYRHAHEAFDAGLASLYKVRTPETALAVVRAVKEMGASSVEGVKVTVAALMAKLGITGRGTAADRLQDAVDRGFLELVEKAGGYGKTSARVFRLTKPFDDIEAEAKSGGGPGVFPTPDEVESMFE
jgi:hypothetical protein